LPSPPLPPPPLLILSLPSSTLHCILLIQHHPPHHLQPHLQHQIQPEIQLQHQLQHQLQCALQGVNLGKLRARKRREELVAGQKPRDWQVSILLRFIIRTNAMNACLL
jgi:hypothetical protein